MPVFVGLDKSPQATRREIQTKRLLEIARDTGVAGRWRANRHAGLIGDGSEPVVKMLVGDAAAGPTVSEWNYRAVRDRDLLNDNIKASFDQIFGRVERIQWAIQHSLRPVA